MNITASALDIIDSENMVDLLNTESFADDRVIVVLDNETSLKFNDYNANDFSYIGCKQVNDLSSYIGHAIETAVQNIARHIMYGEILQEHNITDFSRYNQILCLELEIPSKENVISAISKLQKMDGVLSACPDYKIEATKTADDPEYNNSRLNTVYWDVTSIEQAWNITTGSNTVRVGVLDSGINGSHPDLSGNINSNLSRDFSNSETGPLVDSDGHGTAVAGIIGAVGDNGIGVCGVCWEVELASLKINNDEGEGNLYNIIDAINYAYHYDFDILNMSFILGSEGDSIIYPSPLYEAIDNFPGLVVCSAGNEYQDNDSIPVYPANFNLPNMITVGASFYSTDSNADMEWVYPTNDPLDELDGSNFGLTTVDIFAPGSQIKTTVPSGYDTMQGTSMAAPMVTGVAALMLSANPNLYPEEIKYMIIESADAVNIFANKCVSGGRLNAYEAVKFARDHERQYCGSNKSYHTYRCDDCGFYDDIAHDLYVSSEGTGNRVLRCSICGFAFQCFDAVQYTAIDSMYHVFNCTTCGYKCIEFHGSYTYSSVNSNDYYHIKTCGDCGYSLSESHTWTAIGTSLYKCSVCGRVSTSLIMTLPPEDEELTE